jgi:hypothetical protein
MNVDSLDQLAQKIYETVRQEYPQARSWSELDGLCDANEYFMDAAGEMLPELTKDGRPDPVHDLVFALQDKIDALLRKGAMTDLELLQKLWAYASTDVELGAMVKHDTQGAARETKEDLLWQRDDLNRLQGRTDAFRLILAALREHPAFANEPLIPGQTGNPYNSPTGGLIAPEYPGA